MSPLSVQPRSIPPLFDLPPMGREEDLLWLVRTPGDLILVGQPGSGKTHLLLRLTANPEMKAFFVVDREGASLEEALGALRPKVVIVDDAFEHPEFLGTLRDLRGALDFKIIAATWPYRLRELRAAMGDVPENRVRKLEGWTRREMAALYRTAGIDAREDILVELVRQARNKPGLAATLIRCWQRYDHRRIASGDALMTFLAPTLKRLAGDEGSALLGALALGGRAGVHLERAARFLGIPIATAQRIARDLSASGILEVRQSEALEVVPEELASAALASTFLDPVPIAGWRQFAESLDDKEAVLDALLRAVETGAPHDQELLTSWIRRFGGADSRRRFARLSEVHAELALQAFPQHFVELVPALLHWKPRETIRRLLVLSPPESLPEKDLHEALLGEPPTGLELLGDWLTQGHSHPEFAASQASERKKWLLEEIERFLRRGGDRHVGAEALLQVLGSGLRHTERTLDGLRLGLRLLPPEPQLAVRAWENLSGISSDLAADYWGYCQKLLDGMSEAFRRAGTLALRESWQRLARRVLDDLARAIEPLSAEASQLKVAAGNLEIPMELATDPVLDGLFDWHVSHREAVRRIVEQGRSLDSGEQVDRLLRYAAILGENPRTGGKVATAARQIGGSTSDPLRSLEIWVARGVPALWVGPLLDDIASRRLEGWEERLAALLDHEDYAAPAAIALLNQGNLPARLIEASLAVLRRRPHEAFRLAHAPVEVVRRLLREDDSISRWAVENEWILHRGARPELVAEWEDAVSRASLEDSATFLEEIFAERPNLFRQWLLRHAANPGDPAGPIPFEALEAIARFDEGFRLEILRTLRPNRADEGLVRALVGTSPENYRALLDRSDELTEYAAAPLSFLPDGDWAKLAAVALEETDLGERGVVLAAFAVVTSFDPRDLDVWRPFRPAFEGLAEIPGMAGVAARGIAETDVRIARAQERQRRHELTGSPFADR